MIRSLRGRNGGTIVDENNNKTQNQAIVIIGLVALIIALFIGVKLVFAGLDTAMPDLKHMGADYEARHSASASMVAEETTQGEEQPAPKFCPHCGDGLPESFDWGQFCPWCGEKVE
jgi:membrane protease subunit (stomatin/prohibitin family)